jgi:phosphomannomutase
MKDLITRVENDILKGRGRVVIRKSGNEKMTRIMVESNDGQAANSALAELEKFVKNAPDIS